MRNSVLPTLLGLASKWMLFFCVTLSLAGCVQVGKHRGGSGSSLFVDVKGLQPGDEDLEGIKYQLLCNQDSPQAYAVDGQVRLPKTENNTVDFPDGQLTPGDRCAMAVTATARQNKKGEEYTWLAYKDNKPIVGLFYRSNTAPVELYNDSQKGKTSKYLKFELVMVYGVTYRDPFELQLRLSFVKEENAVIPQRVGLIASLHCLPKDSTDDTKRFQESTSDASPVSGKADERLFKFKLSASKMINTKCNKVTVAIDNVLVYQGDLTEVAFAQPKMGDVVKLGPYPTGVAQEIFGDFSCTERDAANNCQSITFKEPRPIWFIVAKAQPNNPGDEKLDVVITPSTGMSPGPDHVVSVAGVNQSINAANGAFKFYKADVSSDILGASFEPTALQSTMNQKALANADFSVLSFSTVYSHGFKTVSEGYLNALNEARWFAVVSASDGRTLKNLIVGGGNKYFYTPAFKKPAATVYFTADFYKLHLTPSDAYYRSYATQESGLVSSCQMSLDAFRRDLGQQGLSALTGNNAALNACEITDASTLAFLAARNWVLSPRFYVWDWHKLSL